MFATKLESAPEFKELIVVRHLVSTDELGFEVYKYYGYRQPGEHWSERQKTKCLFESHSDA